MKLLDDALDPILKHFKETETLIGTAEKPMAKYEEIFNLPPTGYTSNLRFDWEQYDWDSQPVNLDMMFSTVKSDLWDILLNGDSRTISDPHLKAFDGIRKRGKNIKSLELGYANLFTEFKPTKDTVEYTLYLRVYVEWEDAEPTV